MTIYGKLRVPKTGVPMGGFRNGYALVLDNGLRRSPGINKYGCRFAFVEVE